MESAIVKAEKDTRKKEDPQNSMCKDKELAGKTNSPNTLVKKVNPKHVLVFNITRSRNGDCSIQESFIRHIRSLDRRIPRHIIGHEEKYLKNCLEQIYVSAAKSSSFSIPGMYGYSSNLYDTSSELKIRSRYGGDFTEFATDCPLETAVAVSPSRDWIVGSITGSKSITKILESPLFHQSVRPKLISATKTAGSDSTSPPLSQKMGVLGNDRYRSELVDKRVASVSSTSSTLSDQSFSSSSAGVTQGMLHCTWADGLPHYAFSLDDRKEVYVANALKPESPNGKAVDYVYMFYSRAGERVEHDFNMNEFNLLGKMRVSTTSRLCPNDAEIKETEFVLFGVDEISQTSSSSHVVKKNKGLSKKMVEVFKAGHPSRERSSSKFAGTSTDCTETPILSDDRISPNLELAAIIVKDHVCARREVAKVGGWGLKFLKKVDATHDEIVEAPCPDCSLRNTSGCSTSMDVLVPAGFHGGPRNGGPCSLVDRWRSGGHCDCGGWDIGCPLTILDTKQAQKDVSLQENMEGHCRSLDLFVQGSTQATPVMKMVNIRDGLYFIHFHPRLSPLQCLSIAVANIHTQTPSLQSKVYRR